jgi:hypothetical protein
VSGRTEGQSINDLCKPEKWYFSGYVYLGFTFSPEEEEKNDYISFNSNGTYSSLDKGKQENGTWRVNNHSTELILYKNKSNVVINIKVISITKSELILLVEEGNEKIKMKFDTKK